MTLYELVNNTTIQGHVDIVYFVDGEEKESRTFRHAEDLASRLADLPDGWEDCEVKYMWACGDGYLHIEIYGEEE